LNEKVAAPVLKTEINGRGDPLRWPRDTLYPQKLALISPTSSGRSAGHNMYLFSLNIFYVITRVVLAELTS
jgi:hypothetical protein